jgi:hypothetical protein
MVSFEDLEELLENDLKACLENSLRTNVRRCSLHKIDE